jgi:hypothetical protein
MLRDLRTSIAVAEQPFVVPVAVAPGRHVGPSGDDDHRRTLGKRRRNADRKPKRRVEETHEPPALYAATLRTPPGEFVYFWAVASPNCAVTLIAAYQSVCSTRAPERASQTL